MQPPAPGGALVEDGFTPMRQQIVGRWTIGRMRSDHPNVLLPIYYPLHFTPMIMRSCDGWLSRVPDHFTKEGD